jgi:hypothetical protein
MRASRQRHDTVILCVSPTGNCGGQFRQRIKSGELILIRHAIAVCQGLGLSSLLHCNRGIAPQLPITWEKELRYMDAGERGPKAP